MPVASNTTLRTQSHTTANVKIATVSKEPAFGTAAPTAANHLSALGYAGHKDQSLIREERWKESAIATSRCSSLWMWSNDDSTLYWLLFVEYSSRAVSYWGQH